MRGRPKATTIDEYLTGLSDDKRAALERLRLAILAAAPRAEEYISYQLPALRLDGKPLVAFGVTAKAAPGLPAGPSRPGGGGGAPAGARPRIAVHSGRRYQGVVTLRGVVPTLAMLSEIERAVWSIPGITRIEKQLQVVTSPCPTTAISFRDARALTSCAQDGRKGPTEYRPTQARRIARRYKSGRSAHIVVQPTTALVGEADTDLIPLR